MLVQEYSLELIKFNGRIGKPSQVELLPKPIIIACICGIQVSG